jgi:hypothetical protein
VSFFFFFSIDISTRFIRETEQDQVCFSLRESFANYFWEDSLAPLATQEPYDPDRRFWVADGVWNALFA